MFGTSGLRPSYVVGVNDAAARSVYPAAGSLSIGDRAGILGDAMDFEPMNTSEEAAPAAVSTPDPVAIVGGQKSWLFAGIMFVVLLLILMFAAKRMGEDKEFGSIKASAYNVVVIALAAIIGIPVIKFLVEKLPFEPLKTWTRTV